MGERRHRSEEHARRCAEFAEQLIPLLRARAQELGYALGVHGSLAYDIDLIAVAWVSEAVEAPVLAEALRQVAADANEGVAFCVDRQHSTNPSYFDEGMPGYKPHGRLVWTFHLGGGPYIDLSVIPPRPE